MNGAIELDFWDIGFAATIVVGLLVRCRSLQSDWWYSCSRSAMC